MADSAAFDMSKSAKKRAAKKARDAVHEEAEIAAALVPPAAKAKGKAKAQEPLPLPPQPKAAAKGKSKAAPEPPQAEPKAKAKGKAKAQPEPPAPEPKAKGKAKTEPKAEPTSEPAPAPKAEGKKKKAKAAKQEAEEPAPKPKQDEIVNYVIDDGSGPSWEEASAVSKKHEKRAKKAEDKLSQLQSSSAQKPVQQHVVGMASQGAAKVSAARPGPGPSLSVAEDIQRILAMKFEPPATAEEQAEPKANLSTVSVTVPEKRIGAVIGPKGANIKMLQEKTGVVRIDTSGQIFSISGEPDNVTQCQQAIQELADKGYCSVMFENFGEGMLNVHPSAFPDLIGKEGCIVRKIKEGLKVEVDFGQMRKDAPAAAKSKITLAGSAEDVEKAKNVINNIVMYGHDDLTHPGLVHEEMDIEAYQYRFIIGKGGSEMRHIQGNWHVKVNIPREHSANDKVLIVGEPDQVERAKAYIEKVIWAAEEASKGRERVERTEDAMGEEEAVEPWMKPFMYKRELN